MGINPVAEYEFVFPTYIVLASTTIQGFTEHLIYHKEPCATLPILWETMCDPRHMILYSYCDHLIRK